jgi:hypothetical protein
VPASARPILLLVAVAIAGPLAACGSESGLSKQDLVAKGDKLCTEARRVAPKPPSQQSFQTVERYLDELDKSTTATLAKFKKLKPRESQRKDFEAFLAGAERRLKTIREARDAARARDGGRVTAALAREQQQERVAYRRAATKLGFKVCGSAG